MCGFQYNETASVSQLLWRKTPNNHIHFISTGTIIYSSLFDLMLEKLPSNLIQKFLFLIITSLVVCLPRPDAVTFDWLYSDYLFLFLFLSNEKSLLIHYIVHFCWKPFITYSILIWCKDGYSEPIEKNCRKCFYTIFQWRTFQIIGQTNNSNRNDLTFSHTFLSDIVRQMIWFLFKQKLFGYNANSPPMKRGLVLWNYLNFLA